MKFYITDTITFHCIYSSILSVECFYYLSTLYVHHNMHHYVRERKREDSVILLS